MIPTFHRLLAGLTLLGASALSLAGTMLDPGIVLDDRRGYYVDPEGHTVAIELQEGAAIWRSEGRAWPLALEDAQLWTLAPSERGQLRVERREADSGRVVAALDAPLAEGVVADPRPATAQRFTIHLEVVDGERELHWHWHAWPKRGMPEVDELGRAVDRSQRQSGVLRVVETGDGVRLDPVAALAARRPPGAPLLSGESRQSGIEGSQYQAADAQALLASVPILDPEVGVRYRWTLHAADAAAPLGALDSLYDWQPFVLREGLLIQRRQPLAYPGEDGELSVTPALLIAHDLRRGVERWRQPVIARELAVPLPP